MITKTETIIIMILNHTFRKKVIAEGLPERNHIFLILIKLNMIKKKGNTRKNKTEEYFSLPVSS